MHHLQNNFIVFGPGGRCGSHWVETLLKNLLGVWYTIGSFTPTATGWICHTNDMSDLLDTPAEIRNSVTLIYCVRKNHFDTAVSFLVARNTDEWFDYTSRPVQPFVVDTVKFRNLINELYSLQTGEIPKHILPMFRNSFIIDFDSLKHAEIPEKYIADQLGMDYDTNKNYGQLGSVSNKNPRSYKDLILNWDELVDIYKVFSADHCTHNN